MLILNVKNIIDKNASFNARVFFKTISIGNKKSSNIIVNIPNFSGNYFSIKCIEGGIFVKNLNIPFYLSNGKKVSGEKLHKVNDTFSYENLIFTITDYNFSSIIVPINFSEQIQKRVNEPLGEDLINILKQELLQIDYENNN